MVAILPTRYSAVALGPENHSSETDLRLWHWLDLQDFVADFAAGVSAGRSTQADRPLPVADIGNFTTNARVSRT